MLASSLALALSGLLASVQPMTPVTIPSGFPASMPEFSGIAWAASLSRYLIISDDIELVASHKKHVPWVLAMDDNGTVDSQPIVITGLDELNDPESICAGPSGTFFITTSHSPNQKGNVPASRRKLLHLVLEGRTMRIVGEVDLLQTRQEADGALARLAQASGKASIDIEAISYHADSLYIGLKAPLLPDGRATVLRLASPVSALKNHRIPTGSLSTWRTLSLCLPGSSPSVCQGVSDLAFAPDGALYLVANSPKGMPSDGGGALWKVLPTGAPQLLRQYEHAKPEGISLVDDGFKAVIAFDCDREVPTWLSLRLSP